jgi:hypothetical protein
VNGHLCMYGLPGTCSHRRNTRRASYVRPSAVNDRRFIHRYLFFRIQGSAEQCTLPDQQQAIEPGFCQKSSRTHTFSGMKCNCLWSCWLWLASLCIALPLSESLTVRPSFFCPVSAKISNFCRNASYL